MKQNDASKPEPASERALEGVLVVEVGSRIGTSVCGSLLAQLGATTVFVEGHAGQSPNFKWPHRAQLAAGKLSLDLGTGSEADRDLLRDLIGRADVVLLSPDVDRLDLPRSAQAVICEITAYGSSGPWAGRADSEYAVQAQSGILDTTGNPGDAPVPIGLPVVEYQAGAYAAAAVLAALRHAGASGAGQTVEVALYDCAFAAMATFLPGLLAGTSDSVHRIGNRHAMIAPWNVFHARDGWVLICAGSDAQWARIARIMGRDELATDSRYARIADRVRRSTEVDEAVQAWTATQSVEECLAVLSAAQIACGPVIEIGQYADEPNLHYRNMVAEVRDRSSGDMLFVPGSPLRMSRTPGQAPRAVPAPDDDRAAISRLVAEAPAPSRPAGDVRKERPLAGLKIVEIGHYTTVPLSTKHLAALGAEVIKIEPPDGEATREWPPVQGRQGYFFTYMNSDKRSLVLDIRTEAGAAALWELVETADVLIENLKPGALAKRGFAFAEMSRRNPRLIYAGVSGFGIESLYPGRPAFDTVIQAMSGMMDVVRANGVPMKAGISIADLMGALMAMVSVLGALVHRDRTGLGQSIDLSMQDIAAWMTQTAWNDRPSPSRASVVSCSDGLVLSESEVPDGLSLDSGTRDEAVAALRALGIDASPILTTPEMLRSPQTEARGLWFRAPGDVHDWPLLATPMRLSRTPARVQRPMASLGRDNAAILGQTEPLEAATA